MRDSVDISEFIRYGRLDAYELTDEELAQLLEVWRWTAWVEVGTPSGPDHDVLEAVHALQRRLAYEQNVETEYNTVLLLKAELEPLMHLRVLLDVPLALRYFLRVGGPLGLWRAYRQARRYRRLEPVRGQNGSERGYPRRLLEMLRLRPPNLLKRRYWRPLSPHSFEERKRLDRWW